MPKIFLIFLLSVLSIAGFAAKTKLTSEQQKIIDKIEYTLDASKVEDLLRKFVSKIKDGKPDGKPLRPIEYDITSRKIDEWIKYRWFIADTGLSRIWLKKANELIVYMAKTKRYIDAAKFSGNIKNEKYPQAVKYYDVAYQRLVKLAEKPDKVSSKILRKAKLEKVIWQKAMRKKYKIKDKPGTGDF
jgi:hypothetical protein